MLNIKKHCNELKAKLKQQYPNITDDDLQCNDSMKREMLERLQLKLGKTNEELYEIILKL